MTGLKVVCVGGGLGAPTIMAGLRRYTEDITGLIAVTDSGRSTGKVRIALDVPAPGDIRSALTVLAEGDAALVRLFSHRFATDKSEELNGMAFGNLFLAALTQQEGSFRASPARSPARPGLWSTSRTRRGNLDRPTGSDSPTTSARYATTSAAQASMRR